MLRPDDAAWLAATFGLAGSARLEGPVDRGEQGVVWRLTTSRGATPLDRGGRDGVGAVERHALGASLGTYAVKETHFPLTDEQAASAFEFQLRAAEFGVVAPQQLPAVDGRVMVRDRGTPLRLFAWVELAKPDRAMDAGVVGRVLAALHRAGSATSGWYTGEREDDPWFWQPVGASAWESLVARLGAAGAPFTAGLAALVDDLVALESIVSRPTSDLIVCHRDLWADNLRIGATDGRPVVIDWDNHGPASAAQELAMMLVEFGATAARVRSLYQSYIDSGGPARLTSTVDFTMPIVVLSHLVELGCRQWLEATTDEQRDRATSRVIEFVDDPLRLVDVERLLSQALR